MLKKKTQTNKQNKETKNRFGFVSKTQGLYQCLYLRVLLTDK